MFNVWFFEFLKLQFRVKRNVKWSSSPFLTQKIQFVLAKCISEVFKMVQSGQKNFGNLIRLNFLDFFYFLFWLIFGSKLLIFWENSKKVVSVAANRFLRQKSKKVICIREHGFCVIFGDFLFKDLRHPDCSMYDSLNFWSFNSE